MEKDTLTSLSPEQSRAARAVLGWSQIEAAKLAGLGNKFTLIHFEKRQKKPQPKTLERLRAAYEAAGVTIGDDGLSLSWSAKPSSS